MQVNLSLKNENSPENRLNCVIIFRELLEIQGHTSINLLISCYRRFEIPFNEFVILIWFFHKGLCANLKLFRLQIYTMQRPEQDSNERKRNEIMFRLMRFMKEIICIRKSLFKITFGEMSMPYNTNYGKSVNEIQKICENNNFHHTSHA